MSNKPNWKIWIIPLVAIILICLWGLFIRGFVGTEDKQNFDFDTVPFVPAESPHSSGPDSR